MNVAGGRLAICFRRLENFSKQKTHFVFNPWL